MRIVLELSCRFSLVSSEMAYYPGGNGSNYQQYRVNYMPNLDPSLLATVRDEMLRKEEHRQQQQRQENHKRLCTSYLTKLQALVRDLPSSYKNKFTYDILSSLANAFMDGTVFEIVKGLEDIQQLSERNLMNSRMKLVNSHKAQRMQLNKKHEQSLRDCQHRPHHVPVIKGQNEKEQEDLEKRLGEEMTQLEQKIVLTLDQLVSNQQETLQKAGVPLFFVTNDPEDIQVQMYILDFIQQLASYKGPN